MTVAGTGSKQPFVIAIDGPAGAGKSTVAVLLARRLGVPYFDTGAMYRAAGLLALRAGFSCPLGPAAGPAIAGLLDEHVIEVAVRHGGSRVLVDGRDPGDELRSRRAAMMASAVSALPEVRRRLVAIQRELGHRHGGVMEGRDIGTVVFPDAVLKVYLTASLEERARRRMLELERGGEEVTLAQMEREVAVRDRQDSSRADSPLLAADGALHLDTTGMIPEEVVDLVLDEVRRRRGRALDSNGREAVRSRNDAS